MRKLLIMLATLLMPAVIQASPQFNDEQIRLLITAHSIGDTIGWPETLQGILLQETLAGKFGNRIGDLNEAVGQRSYGVTQVKVSTARFVMKRHPELKDLYFGKDRRIRQIPDEEVIVLLMTDDEAALTFAAQYFLYMWEAYEGYTNRWARAVTAYNTGLSGSKNIKKPSRFPYVEKINTRIKTQIRAFNKKYTLAN